MTDRLKSMKRLARLQGQVKRLAEADLETAQNRKREAEADVLALDTMMGDPDLSSRLMSLAMGQRRRVAVRSAQADDALAEQVGVTREARSRSRLAERMVEDLDREEKRVEERKDLERIIETMAYPRTDPDSSLP